jgi:thiamine monophosphate kinase
MQSQNYNVRWIGKEVVRCSASDFSCDVPCYYDPGRKAFTAVLGDLAVRGGLPSRLTVAEAAQVEKALVEALGARRLFGLAIGRVDVYVQRQQQLS